MFTGKVAVVTGGAKGIGRAIAELFRQRGAAACILDKEPKPYFTGDCADRETLERFAAKVVAEHGKIDFLVNNAKPLMQGVDSCSWDDFLYAFKVGAAAPFWLARLFEPHFAPGASIVNISSSRDRMSQPGTESYTAAKGALSALTHALAASLAGRVRVNAVSPGWIDTEGRNYSGPDAEQHPAGRVGTPQDIAEMVMFLCSDKAGFITGENICIDGGMTKLMIYHGDCGWTLQPK